jgi:hypothetical protein
MRNAWSDPVPRDVDEPDERTVVRTGDDPPEAVRPDAVPPAGLGIAAVRADERDHLVVA